MTKFHVIEPGGGYLTSEWGADQPLEDGCIPLATQQTILHLKHIEHVTVIWKGRRAHMFVNAMAFCDGGEVNARATRIYMNAILRREGFHDQLYDDLSKPPAFREEDTSKSVKLRILLRSISMILGPALLWEGDYE